MEWQGAVNVLSCLFSRFHTAVNLLSHTRARRSVVVAQDALIVCACWHERLVKDHIASAKQVASLRVVADPSFVAFGET